MLRITRDFENSSLVKIKLEGQIIAEWVTLLKDECQALLKASKRINLDFSEVTFIDASGARMLNRLPKENVEHVNCSGVIKNLLVEAGNLNTQITEEEEP